MACKNEVVTKVPNPATQVIEETTSVEVSSEMPSPDTPQSAENVVAAEDKEMPNKTLIKEETSTKTTAKNLNKKRKPKKARPKAKLDFDVIRHDFGTITQGDTVSFNFNFTNNGKAPLEIETAKASCGCTQPSFPFIPIEPGDSGFIGVMYVSVGKEGYQEPTITVNSNATKEPITLQMTGNVELPPEEESVEAEKATESVQDSIGQN